jgi:hypothetical protein
VGSLPAGIRLHPRQQVTRHASRSILPGLVLSSLCLGFLDAGAVARPFPLARVHLEQNATDGDMEVVFEVTGVSKGLATLVVTSPRGRRVIDFAARDSSDLGMREFHFESPEPEDVGALKAAFPEGVYTFVGTTAGGDALRSESRLSHRLPPPTSLLRPAPGSHGLPVLPLEIAWKPVPNAAAYAVQIEQEELNFHVLARVPGSTTRFEVPAAVLLPGKSYHLAIGSESSDGNTSFVETTFSITAAPRGTSRTK